MYYTSCDVFLSRAVLTIARHRYGTGDIPTDENRLLHL